MRQEDLEPARVRESVRGSGADTLSRRDRRVQHPGEGDGWEHQANTHVHSPECKIRSHPIPVMQGLCPARGRIRVPQVQLVKLRGWHGTPMGGDVE